ncbi:MAG TPA: hypothetical protein VGO47_10820 [Chlamydiales bacterium]|nr:hypothetical protein [Chlamydiales bacterium]
METEEGTEMDKPAGKRKSNETYLLQGTTRERRPGKQTTRHDTGRATRSRGYKDQRDCGHTKPGRNHTASSRRNPTITRLPGGE